jgi:hypothetical protein
MKIFKKLIVFLLCIQGASLVAMKAEPKKMEQADKVLLNKSLNATINSSVSFYATKSFEELRSLIALVNTALANQKTLDFFSAKFQKPVSEIQALLNKTIQNANDNANRLRSNVVTPSPATYLEMAKAARVARAPSKPAEREMSADSGNHLLHIMLEVPDLDSRGKPIGWQKAIDPLMSQMKKVEGAEFVPTDYYHITLARYKSGQPFPQDFLPKVEQALSRAQEILKIVYPRGARGISLVDRGVLLGKSEKPKDRDTVAFRVAAESVALEKVQGIIAKFISFEGITDFQFRSFNGEKPFHLSLGRIKPKKIARTFRGMVNALHAPEGTRVSQGQEITINRISLGYNTKENPRQIIKTYDF